MCHFVSSPRVREIDWLCWCLMSYDVSTLVGHFVFSPREREKKDRREEKEEQGKKKNRNENEETE